MAVADAAAEARQVSEALGLCLLGIYRIKTTYSEPRDPASFRSAVNARHMTQAARETDRDDMELALRYSGVLSASVRAEFKVSEFPKG